MTNNKLLNKQLFDKNFRTKLKADPKAYIESLNNAQLEGVDYKVVESSKDVFYVVMPYVDGSINSQDIDNIIAAACVGSAGTLGTAATASSASSASTVCGSVSSASSASTLGCLTTAGTAGSK